MKTKCYVPADTTIRPDARCKMSAFLQNQGTVQRSVQKIVVLTKSGAKEQLMTTDAQCLISVSGLIHMLREAHIALSTAMTTKFSVLDPSIIMDGTEKTFAFQQKKASVNLSVLQTAVLMKLVVLVDLTLVDVPCQTIVCRWTHTVQEIVPQIAMTTKWFATGDTIITLNARWKISAFLQNQVTVHHSAQKIVPLTK